MQMLEIAALPNGAHRNQTYNGELPDGWALIPDKLGTLRNFPFGTVEVQELEGVSVVVSWEPGELPEASSEQTQEQPTQLDRIEAQLTYTALMTDTLLEVE